MTNEQIPSRVRYYLLDYRDRNMDEYIRKYGETKLKDLTIGQINAYFQFATSKDLQILKPNELKGVSNNEQKKKVCIICNTPLVNPTEDDNCCDECWLKH